MNRGIPSNCGCGGEIRTLTSGTQENPGRPFYQAVLEEVEDVLPKVAVHEIEIAKMKADIEDLMEVALNNKVEIQKNKVMIKTLMVYSLFVRAAFVVYVLY
ncbi:hypothetical protein Bca52824_030736 [Brassica carinata]|uniref:Uncharacterized protein n=1 Tax=Brassica carinata TaxID=52824 RepID=A0A8X7V3H3_BRACI|nr:hypothetical protein Bca52824_030736 [Brassica carinata]